MKFDNIKVYNFENAIRGMRNPKNSWHLSDSFFGLINLNTDEHDYEVASEWVEDYIFNHPEDKENKEQLHEGYDKWLIKNGVLNMNQSDDIAEVAFIGPNDMRLAKALIKGGPEHRKFLRQIMVSVDITAPLFYWKEFDTYKVGTTANSTSTMHKLTSKPITLECFETDDYDEDMFIERVNQSNSKPDFTDHWHMDMFAEGLVEHLEDLRQMYLKTKDKRYWKELVRWLPESWLQTRTVTMNYENLLSMVHQRKNHKLTEWSKSFMNFAKDLPYASDFIFIEK